MKLATRMIHGGPTIDAATGALGVPIYQISTYRQTSAEQFGKYDYARGDNPTREALEELVANLEGGGRCLAFASGMAAISTPPRLSAKEISSVLTSICSTRAGLSTSNAIMAP